MSLSDDDTATANDDGEADEIRQVIADALDTLPRLTRAVILLHRIDDLPYDQIAWRCGISVDEVVIRMGDAMTTIRHHRMGATRLIDRFRSALVPWRASWMQHRRKRRDRRLGITPRG